MAPTQVVLLFLSLNVSIYHAFSFEPLNALAFQNPMPRHQQYSSRRRRNVQSQQRHQTISRAKNDFQWLPNDSTKFEYETKPLPIFPLRKRVRYPLDKLNLNLYEERYLALCDYMINEASNNNYHSSSSSSNRNADFLDSPCYFGALYCSDKPQIVPFSGMGPITPLFEKGDIGVLCSVVSYSDSNAIDSEGDFEKSKKTATNSVHRQRKVNVKAEVVGRFRIESILQNGFDGDDGQSEKNPLPFILVSASEVKDARISSSNQSITPKLDPSHHLLTLLQKKEFLHYTNEDANTLYPVHDYIVNRIVNYNNNIDDDNDDDDHKLLDFEMELTSFFAISTLLSNLSPQEAMDLLCMTCTMERIKYVLQRACLHTYILNDYLSLVT